MKQYCQCKRVYPGMKYALPCAAKAKVERDGVLYCGRHDPVTLKVARDKREAVRKARDDALRTHLDKLAAARADQARKAALFDELITMGNPQALQLLRKANP